MKRTLIAATALIVTATLAGCADDEEPKADPTPSALPPASATTPQPTTSSASPSVASDVWREKFTNEQLREFDHALRTWKNFSETMEKYYREPPEDLAKVRTVYEQYTYNASALFDSYVMNFGSGGVRQVGAPTPVSWTGRKVDVNEKGSLVVFDQCTDYTTLDIRRDGKPIKGAAPTKNDTAIIRVQMGYQPATGTTERGWRVASSKVVDKPCE